jgi:hypothetical protein
MAISYDNAITKNYHGMMGGIVFRCIGDKSIMSKRPDCSKVVKTEAQKANMKRFAAATIYAKKVLNDPKKVEYYRKKKKIYQSVWNAAISDFMSRPKVVTVDLNAYRGLKGNVISVSAWDKFKVEAVNVMIYNDMNQLVESGPAVARSLSGSMEWDYKATVMNPSYRGCRVVVRVSDLPGNVVQEAVIVDST